MGTSSLNVDTNKLKVVMVRNGESPKSLANGSGLSYETIRRVFNSGVLQIKSAIKITKYLGIDIEDII